MNVLSPPHLVDMNEGTVSREIFSSDTIFRAELERIFAPSWAFVGHVTQIPKRGDHFLSIVGQESVIVVRDQHDGVRVLLNSCRHRGMAPCRYDAGHAASFTCPYHGWSYGLDGALTGVPLLNEGYRGKLDRTKWGLANARVEVFSGTIWATFDAAAPDFQTYAGDMAYYLRDLMQSPDGEDDGYEVIPGIMKWNVPANWKFGAENFSGDHYHGFSHRSVDRLGISKSGQKTRHPFATITAPYKFLNVSVPGGHTARVNLFDENYEYQSMWASIPEVDDYYRRAHERRAKRLGDRARLFNRGGIVFPNMHYNTGGRTTIGVWVPRAAGEMEVWRWMFVPKDAPQIVKDTLRHFYLRYAGPGGMTEQDDMENWSAAQSGTTGTIAKTLPFVYQLNAEPGKKGWPEPWIGEHSSVVEDITEHNQRSFYTRWAELMNGAV